ncbi:MAG: SUMF1/EgtB/PvdO family nonheme iron enzyme, partial [Spirochaetales bacterium]|nr:SUMF1/EgtB/PvdO family nonheme iron enzyme [Spirochaetales bacterium]
MHNARDVLKKTVKGRDKHLAGYADSLMKGKAQISGTGETEAPREIIHEEDTSEMVLIPAGPFLYGSKEDDKEALQDEKPQRVIELPAFYMDKYPVTNRQFCLFLNEVQPGRGQPERWIDFYGSYEKEKCRIGLQ